MAEYLIQTATLSDIAEIANQRRAMFAEMQVGTPAILDEMTAKYHDWLHHMMTNNDYLEWFAVGDDGIAAGAGVWFFNWQPSPRNTNDRIAYILNVYTYPDHRGQGLARRLVETIIAYCRETGISTVNLHASAAGAPLYQKLGFVHTNEMRLYLD